MARDSAWVADLAYVRKGRADYLGRHVPPFFAQGCQRDRAWLSVSDLAVFRCVLLSAEERMGTSSHPRIAVQ